MEGLVTSGGQAFCVPQRGPIPTRHVPNMYHDVADAGRDREAPSARLPRGVVASWQVVPVGSPSPSGRFPYWIMSATTTGQLLDIAGLADRLGVGERFVRRLVSERRIPFLKIGRHVRFEADAVEAWISESRVEPSQPFPTRTLTGARR